MVKGLKRKSGYQSLKCLGAKGLLKKKRNSYMLFHACPDLEKIESANINPGLWLTSGCVKHA